MAIKATWLLLITALVSGISIFLNSFAVKGFDSSVFTFAKNITVAILLFSIIYAIGKFPELKSLSRKDWLQLMVIGLIGGSIPFLLFFEGLQLSSGAATASFIHKTLFIFSAILAIIFLKEKLNKWTLIGVVGILAGTYFMIRPDFKFSWGDALILGAVVLWSFENILAKKALKHLSGTVVAFGRMFFGSLFIMSYLTVTGKVSLLSTMHSSQYLWIALTSVLLFLYVITYYNGLKHVTVTTATAILSLGAPITAILSWVFGTKAIAPYDVLGVFLITASCCLLVWMTAKVNMRTTTHA